MALVYLVSAPASGLISVRAAGSLAELLVQLSGMPDHIPSYVEDVGECDPAEVVREASRHLPRPVDPRGLVRTSVEEGRRALTAALAHAGVRRAVRDALPVSAARSARV